MLLTLATLAVAAPAPAVGATADTDRPDTDAAVRGVSPPPVPLPDGCETGPPIGQLVHLECGPTRAVVAQVRPLDTPLHDEIVTSLLDVVPDPQHLEARPEPGPLARTVWVQGREALGKGAPSVRLVVESRRSTGQTVACILAVDGRRKTRRDQEAWCASMIASLAPPPADATPATTIEVSAPDLPAETLDGPDWRVR